MEKNRRNFIKRSTALAALPLIGLGSVSNDLSGMDKANADHAETSTQKGARKKREWPVREGSGLPYLCMVMSPRSTADEMRQMKQLGIDHVHMGGGPIPWTLEELSGLQDRFKGGWLCRRSLRYWFYPCHDAGGFISVIKSALSCKMIHYIYRFFATLRYAQNDNYLSRTGEEATCRYTAGCLLSHQTYVLPVILSEAKNLPI